MSYKVSELVCSCCGPSGKGTCVQLWYHMYGRGVGTLNVYQQSEDGKQALIFSQAGNQGRLWRFAQAGLLPPVQPYRVSRKDAQTNNQYYRVLQTTALALECLKH